MPSSSSSSSCSRAAAMPARASVRVRDDHQAKSRSVAGPCEVKYRRANSPQGVAALGQSRVRYAVLQQRPFLLADQHDHRGLRQLGEQVHAALACRRQPALLPCLEEFRSRDRRAVGHPLARDRSARSNCAWSSSSWRRRPSADRTMRWPVSDSIHGRSSAATKCSVPRIGQERTNAPVSWTASMRCGSRMPCATRSTTGRPRSPAPASRACRARPRSDRRAPRSPAAARCPAPQGAARSGDGAPARSHDRARSQYRVGDRRAGRGAIVGVTDAASVVERERRQLDVDAAAARRAADGRHRGLRGDG